MKHTLAWFQNRIRKTVYRKDVSCPCDTCKQITKCGLKICDNEHAEYLYLVQYDLRLDYQDKPYKR